MFSLVPVRASAELRPEDGVAALLWLPAVGGILGAVAALPVAATREWAPHASLLGAVLAIGALSILTRCLHLDGLADTADGLASREPAPRALEIMRQSDIGPFGVVALVLLLGADIAALAVMRGGVWAPVVALALGAATGRVGAVAAAMRGIPAARTSGFGTLVTGGIAPVAVLAWVAGVLGAGVALAAAVGMPIGWVVVSQAIALLVAFGGQVYAVRRLGGMTGDVFGALIEVTAMATLVGIALR